MAEPYTEVEIQRIRTRMRRVAWAIILWVVAFIVVSVIWAVTVGDTYNGPLYFGLFMVAWFFGVLVTVSYFVDVESTESILKPPKK